MRGQTTLPTVGLALVVLVAVGSLVVVAGDAVVDDADRQALDRQAAVALSDRLVEPGGGIADRPNVLNESRLSRLDPVYVTDRLGLAEDRDVRIRLGERELVSSGSPTGGVSFERIVLVERETTTARSPRLVPGRGITVPRRVGRAWVELSPPAGTTVRGVRADGGVVLHDDDGLDGTFAVNVSRFETTRLTVDAVGPLPAGSVTLRFHPPVTRKAILEVTVDG